MAKTKGATSLVFVKLKELAANLGPEANIPISRLFATANGLISTPRPQTQNQDKNEETPIVIQEID